MCSSTRQARVERAGVRVGVVETIVGLHGFAAVVYRKADHAGTTALDMRTDALPRVLERTLAEQAWD